MGMVGPFGTSSEALWNALIRGNPLFQPYSRYSLRGLAGAVRNFHVMDYVKKPRVARSPRISQYALMSAVQAITDANINKNIKNTAIVYGTGTGPTEATENILDAMIDEGLGTVEPLLFQECVFNAPASLISIHFKIRGPLIVLPMDWVTGGFALKVAVDFLRHNDINSVIVVVSDELSQSNHEARRYLKLVSPNDGGEEGMRPFDQSHNGAILSEGSVALILEKADNALQRKAPIYGEIASCATGSDAYRVGANNPDGSGLTRVMRQSMARANINPEDVDCLLAGTFATKQSDLVESRAVTTTFTDHLPPVTSIKSVIGEMGASGLFNVVAGLLAIRNGLIPATVGITECAPECEKLDIVMSPRRLDTLKTVMVNSFFVSGVYASAVLRAWS